MRTSSIISSLLVVSGVVSGLVGFLYQDNPLRGLLLWLFVACLAIAFILWVTSKIGLVNHWANLRTLHRCGIKSLYYMGEGARDLKKQLSNASLIRIMAVSAESLIKAQKDAFVTALIKNRADIRILVGKPDSEFIADVEDIESQHRKNTISEEIDKVQKFCREILDESRLKSKSMPIGKIKVRFFRTHLRSSLIMVDNSWAWMTLNLPPKRALQSLSFELAGNPDGLFEDANAHFESVWKWAGKFSEYQGYSSD